MEHATPLRFHRTSEPATVIGSPWSTALPPAPALQATVIIPAKDEAATIAATLAALASQTDLLGCPLPRYSFEVLVLANNCRDRTAQVARETARRYPQLTVHVAETTLPLAEAHIGKARRLLMDEACRRLELAGHPNAFIASTDADTLVSSTWLVSIAAELAAGADAVGGRILTPAPATRCALRRCQLQDATYQLLCARLEQTLDPAPHDPWPRHHQHFGASLALTVSAYRRVGGLPVVPYLEDEALYQALLRHDLCLRHSPAVRVFTSDRQVGRVAVGLSWQLRQWAGLGQQQEPTVPHPARLAAEWTVRRQLRQLWAQPADPAADALAAVGAATGLSAGGVIRQLQRHATFGQLWETIRGKFHRRAATQGSALPVTAAIQLLRQQLAAQPTVGALGQLGAKNGKPGAYRQAQAAQPLAS